jgi:hypothetical protein
MRRPTLDELQTDQNDLIGPPCPPQIPKFTPAASRSAVYQMMLEDLRLRIIEESRQALERDT